MVFNKRVTRRDFLVGSSALASAILVGCESVSTPPQSARKLGKKALPNKRIQSVLGPILPDQLGTTSMHEHVLQGDGSGYAAYGSPKEMFDEESLEKMAYWYQPEEVPDSFFPEPPEHPITLQNRHYLKHHYANSTRAFLLDQELMVGELSDFKQLGGQSVLDVSISYQRGDPNTIKEMSRASGINVIMSTGVNDHISLPKRFKQMNQSQFVEYFEKELFEGIRDTDVLAGNIKLLADSESTGMKATDNEVLLLSLKAASSVSKNTGAPITVHCYGLADSVLKELLDVAVKSGLPKDRLIISHFPTLLRPMDYQTLLNNPEKFIPNLDIGYWAMDQGFILSFDLFGAGSAWIDTRDGQVPNSDLYSLLAIYQYAKNGYADQIVLGTDIWTRMGTRKHGGGGIVQLLNFVLPTLDRYGVSEIDLNQMMIGTPARLLAFRDP